MAWVIAVLGAALAVGGGAALWNGSGYIRLDWGQAQTVAGTVALSAGVVTIAIAAVLFALRDATRGALGGLARRPAPAETAPALPFPASGVGLEAVHLDAAAEEAVALERSASPAATAIPASARDRLAGRLARVGVPKPDGGDPALAEPSPPGVTPALSAVPTPATVPVPEPEPPYAEPPYAEPPYDPRPHAVPEAPRPVMPMLAEAPTVVGRYEANGASYVLFSDGTIEVETDSGTHRFGSMAELKDHIERQGSA